MVPRVDVREPLALREDSAGFEDNSDKLRSPAAARAALTTVAVDIVEGSYDVTLIPEAAVRNRAVFVAVSR